MLWKNKGIAVNFEKNIIETLSFKKIILLFFFKSAPNTVNSYQITDHSISSKNLSQGCHSLSQKIFPEWPETSLSVFLIVKK